VALQKYPSFGSGVAFTATTNLFLSLLGLLTGVLSARLLGAAGRGELGAIQTWPSVLGTLAVLGLPDALTYYCARRPEDSGLYLTSAISLALLVSVPFGLAAYFVMPWLLSAQMAQVISLARLYLAIIPLYGLGMMSFPLRGRNDLYTWNLLRLSPSVGWLIVLLIGWILGEANPGFFAKGHLIVLSVLCIPTICVVVNRVPGPFRSNSNLWQPMLKFGLPSLASSAPQILNVRMDQMLMAAFLPARVLGLYVVAVAWSGAVNPIINALGTVLFPRVASGNTETERARRFAEGTRLAVALAVVICIGVMLITPMAIALLFGNDFREAIPVTLVLVLGAGFIGVNLVLSEGIRGMGQPISVFWAEAGGLVTTSILLFLLLKRLGIMGAGIASLAAYATVTILLVIQARKITALSFRTMLFPKHREFVQIVLFLRDRFKASTLSHSVRKDADYSLNNESDSHKFVKRP
jgi:O-antigen/teichoic acid export membrane protein